MSFASKEINVPQLFVSAGISVFINIMNWTKDESNIMPYEPYPGATVKEIVFDPRNMAITFIVGIGLGLFLELMIRIFA